MSSVSKKNSEHGIRIFDLGVHEVGSGCGKFGAPVIAPCRFGADRFGAASHAPPSLKGVAKGQGANRLQLQAATKNGRIKVSQTGEAAWSQAQSANVVKECLKQHGIQKYMIIENNSDYEEEEEQQQNDEEEKDEEGGKKSLGERGKKEDAVDNDDDSGGGPRLNRLRSFVVHRR
ncbi:hypothetical protein GPALN_009742 [Globodera pallida]|nr:hypothetical protein GPALN_009742 [Globodera pallida]